MNKEYKIYNGTSYDTRTPEHIIHVIDQAIQTRKRVVLKYKEGYEDFTGYTKDGLTVHMYIGRSCGSVKIPLHIVSTRSSGGAGLLDCAIEWIKIK